MGGGRRTQPLSLIQPKGTKVSQNSHRNDVKQREDAPRPAFYRFPSPCNATRGSVLPYLIPNFAALKLTKASSCSVTPLSTLLALPFPQTPFDCRTAGPFRRGNTSRCKWKEESSLWSSIHQAGDTSHGSLLPSCAARGSCRQACAQHPSPFRAGKEKQIHPKDSKRQP